MTWTFRGIVVVLVGFVAGLSAAARQTELTPSGIPALIVQLASPESEWGAAARLQKLGTPAAAALVGNLRRDGFVSRWRRNPACFDSPAESRKPGLSGRETATLAIDCPRLVAVFDRQRGVDRLNSLLTQPYSLHVARTLVELGDSRGIPVLIELLESPENAARSLSYQALRRYTQEDIAYNADASPDSRRAAADQWRQWWRNSGSGFALKTKAARIDIDCCRR